MLVPIIIAIVALIAITILLKICSKHYMLNLILLIAAGVGIMVSSFAMPKQPEFNWNLNWMVPQAICVFLYIVMLSADIAFDTEEYVNTTVTEHWDGSVTASSKLENRSLFWGTIGGGLVITAVLVLLNYMIFPKNAVGLGVVGCLATGWSLIQLIVYLVSYFRARRRRNNNYYG